MAQIAVMSRWKPRPAGDAPDHLILFDGVCIFCSRWVAFVIRHDPKARFRFVTIQSEAGRRLAEAWGIDPHEPETNAVVLDGSVWFKSDAALKVLERLSPTRPLGLLRAVPRALRDLIYDPIAARRYEMFGRTEECPVPSPEMRERLL